MGDGEKEEVIWSPPSKVEDLFPEVTGSLVASMNRPVAGATHEQRLPRGEAPFQVYSLATPNGQKVGIVCEELVSATAKKARRNSKGNSRKRHRRFEYDAHIVRIAHGEQFGTGFVGLNPNSKIPAAIDLDPDDSSDPVRLWESASIAIYLCEKYNKFIPRNPAKRAECISWVMWQMASQGPMTGNFGHFYVYAPNEKIGARAYGTARYGMEVQRLCSVLDRHLSDGRKYLVRDEYTVADMICLPWFAQIRADKGYKHAITGINARNFLTISPERYPHACAWADRLMRRPEVQRGMLVCRKYGKPWLKDDRFTHLSKL